MAIFHIDADAFFPSVEQGFNPLLRNRMVIVGGSEKQRGVVHSACYKARKRGVKTGMPLIEAKGICPEAVFLKGNYQQYHAASLTLQKIYLKYTPAVEFTSLDDAYLNMKGTAKLYPSFTALARCIQQDVWQALAITVSIGIGSNKLLARIASGLRKPNGIYEIAAGREDDFLGGLPVEYLPGIGRKTRYKLQDLGITKINELAALPKLVLNQAFGATGNIIWQMANGIDERPVRQRILPGQISRATTFPEDLTDPAIILATLQYLGERICMTLREQEQECRQVSIYIRYSDGTSQQTSRTLSEPTHHSPVFFSVIKLLNERIRPRRVRIRHVGIRAERISWQQRQLQLIDSERRVARLDNAVDEIRQKFGFMAIASANILALNRKYRKTKNGFVLHSPALTK